MPKVQRERPSEKIPSKSPTKRLLLCEAISGRADAAGARASCGFPRLPGLRTDGMDAVPAAVALRPWRAPVEVPDLASFETILLEGRSLYSRPKCKVSTSSCWLVLPCKEIEHPGRCRRLWRLLFGASSAQLSGPVQLFSCSWCSFTLSLMLASILVGSMLRAPADSNSRELMGICNKSL